MSSPPARQSEYRLAPPGIFQDAFVKRGHVAAFPEREGAQQGVSKDADL
jgi:hypothetical protein